MQRLSSDTITESLGGAADAGTAAESGTEPPWNRWLARVTPRRKWQWATLLTLGPVLLAWLLLTASATTMETATVYVSAGEYGIANPDAVFDFGDLPRAAGIEHQLIIRNDGKLDTLVKISITGEISDFITIDDSLFSLNPGEQREIQMELKVPASAPVDQRFSGRAVIVRMPYVNPF